MKKGQTVELLGFLLLVVVVVIVFLTINYLTAGTKIDVMELTQESQDINYFNAGANTFSAITEPKTNKTFVELIGLAGYFEKNILEFGPAGHKIQVNVFDETSKRLDIIYGKGHWHMDIHNAPPYQIYVIILIDASKSMKDEIEDIRDNIGYIITDVKKTTGKRVFYKLYFLQGGESYMAMFDEAVKEFPNLKTYNVNFCTLTPEKNEAWAEGMKCLIDKKSDEWGGIDTAKVGIILSDEPPSGCEDCGCKHYNDIITEGCCPADYATSCYKEVPATCAEKDSDIAALITTANILPMNIYTLKADPCGYPTGVTCNYPYPYTCAGEQKLIGFMDTLSTGTNAQRFDVDDPESVSKAIKDIVLAHPIPDVPSQLGTAPPEGKVIHSYVIPAPTPIPGAYVKIVLKQWN